MRYPDDFHVEYWLDRPWAIVWDPHGFREPGSETFLTFWAWQDLPARRIRRQAQHLSDAWNYLRAIEQHWATARWTDWEEWASTMTCGVKTPRQLAAQVDTLYRYYGFWHWYDPQQVPRQYWPTNPQMRAHWLRHIWDEADPDGTDR